MNGRKNNGAGWLIRNPLENSHLKPPRISPCARTAQPTGPWLCARPLHFPRLRIHRVAIFWGNGGEMQGQKKSGQRNCAQEKAIHQNTAAMQPRAVLRDRQPTSALWATSLPIAQWPTPLGVFIVEVNPTPLLWCKMEPSSESWSPPLAGGQASFPPERALKTLGGSRRSSARPLNHQRELPWP